MKKRIVSIILSAVLILGALAPCLILLINNWGNPPHTCTWENEWTTSESHHWHKCKSDTCELVKDKNEHTWDEGEITTPATKTENGVKTFTCEVCEYTKTESVEYVVVTTVTENEWISALALNVNNLRYVMTSVGRNVVWEYDGEVLYQFQEIDGQSNIEKYFVTDGTNYYEYEKIGEEDWVKHSISEDEYKNRMQSGKPDMSLMFMFSEFEYNAESKTYFAETCQISEEITNITLSFEDGLLMSIQYTLEDEEMNMTFEYEDITLVVPQI